MTAEPIDLHWVQQPGSKIGDVLRPATLAEALGLLAEHPELRPVAGGTDLLLDLARSGQSTRVPLLDLTRIDGLRSLDFDDRAEVIVGAAVTHADLLGASAAPEQLLPLAQACLEVGSPQLRNRATIVGNVVTASPANDTISALVALDATVSCVSLDDGQLTAVTYPIDAFYTGFRSTVLRHDQLIDQISVPKLSEHRRGIWVKAGLRKAQAISVVHAGLVLEFDSDDVITSARIALGSVGPTVALSAPAAEALVGRVLTNTTIQHAADAAADSVTPIDDQRATADYRRDSVVAVVSRALTALGDRRERERWPRRVPLLSLSAVASARSNDVPAHVAESDEIRVNVNDSTAKGPVRGMGTLLEWLRDNVGTGTKEGCAEGECGACTVQLDGDAVMSCLVPAVQAQGAEVMTIEGLSRGDESDPMQRSFVEKFAVQCGFCIPGFVVAAATLAAELDAPPTRDEVEFALAGNLCRCTGYYNIIDAVIAAVATEVST